MKTAELSNLLGAPINWQEPYFTKRDAMALITVTRNNTEKSVLISPRGLMQVDSDNYVLAPKERNQKKVSYLRRITAQIIKITSWIILSMLTIASISLITNTTQARVVLTDSMSPHIVTGKKFDGTPVASFTHRVIGGDQTSGFVVKGDKNESPDVQKPVLNEIEAVMLFTIPSLGLLLTPQSLTLLLFTFFGLWLIFDAFRMGRR